MKSYTLYLCLLLSLIVNASEIPHLKVTISPAYLDSMYAHGDEEIYFPAQLKVDTSVFNVKVRFKGSTSLLYPKKSWAIKFENNLNPFRASRINLHADYKDYSSMRNFLLLRLFDHLGMPSPQIRHITYEVNEQPYGVYTQVEQIDEEFLERNGKEAVALYKANNHGGLMAPAVRDEYYKIIWEMDAGTDKNFDDLRRYLNKCLYWSKEDFDNNIEKTINTDNFLTFFAVHFVFVDLDNFTKNIFLNKNSNTQKYELIPWDNEGSFGNSALGQFNENYTSYNFNESYTPEYQVVLKRLLENQYYRTIFKSKVNQIINQGYQFLDTLIDSTYLRIKQDVYNDQKKEATNIDFDNSVSQLKTFMTKRKLFLQNNNLPERYPLTNFYFSTPYPSSENPFVTVRATSPVAQHVNVFFADSVNFNRFGRPFKFSRLQLYDDGTHSDLLANDLIYGNTINTNEFSSSLIPFSFTGAEQNYPPNGIFYIDYYGSKSFALNKGNIDQDVASKINIGDVYQFNGKSFVQITNKSVAASVDLSYHHLRTVNSFEDFMFRDNVVLAPSETIYLSANKELGQFFFPNHRVFNDLYYNVAPNDSLKLFSSVISPLISRHINAVNILAAQKRNLLFNEINFKSGPQKPSGDWVEIYNPGDSLIDMTNWKYKDAKNSYKFPVGYILKPNEYVVVAEDTAKFKSAHPYVKNVVGNADFGLSGSGEYILLFDNIEQLVDSVHYNIVDPWPINAAGTGHTLELKDHILDNNLGQNWFVDDEKEGSPGQKNYLTAEIKSLDQNSVFIYPNPAINDLYIKSSSSELTVEIITLQGMIINSARISMNTVMHFDISMLSRGIYLVKINNDRVLQTTKLIVK